ncbi:hypothetical protein ACFYZ4_11685 [Streptomyces sp. NPDC001513]|uniref:hypothetical protein n=1 Tax=Streptomyces sp. NPDC001513 TaxID=3364580 RepID=UPI003677423F
MTKHAIRLAITLKSRWEDIKEGRTEDRGDISITTIIIWVAVVTGAIATAGALGVLITKYNGKLSGI